MASAITDTIGFISGISVQHEQPLTDRPEPHSDFGTAAGVEFGLCDHRTPLNHLGVVLDEVNVMRSTTPRTLDTDISQTDTVVPKRGQFPLAKTFSMTQRSIECIALRKATVTIVKWIKNIVRGRGKSVHCP